jgi:hypothetical protein
MVAILYAIGVNMFFDLGEKWAHSLFVNAIYSLLTTGHDGDKVT